MMVRTAASTSLRLGFWASTLDVARSSACTLGLITVFLHSGANARSGIDIQPLDGPGAEWFPGGHASQPRQSKACSAHSDELWRRGFIPRRVFASVLP